MFDSFGLPILEMARVPTRVSGLPMTVVILVGHHLPHGPRIKVSTLPGGKVRAEELLSVTISDTPEFIGDKNLIAADIRKKIIEFVIKNKETLTKHYYGEIDDLEALLQIKSVA